jgi:hypothetical protein
MAPMTTGRCGHGPQPYDEREPPICRPSCCSAMASWGEQNGLFCAPLWMGVRSRRLSLSVSRGWPGSRCGGDHMGVRSQVRMVRTCAVRRANHRLGKALSQYRAPGLTSSSAHIATDCFHRAPAGEARNIPAAGGFRPGRPCASAGYARRPVAAARCCPGGCEVESVEVNFCVILPCFLACRGTCSAHRRWHWRESRGPAHRRGLPRRAMGAGREYVMDKAGGIER